MTWGPDDPRVLSTPNQPEPFKGIISQNRGVLNPDTIMNAFNPFERQELRKAIIFDIGKEVPGLFHRYVYVLNNPVNFVDPTGQFLVSGIVFVGYVYGPAIVAAGTAAAYRLGPYMPALLEYAEGLLPGPPSTLRGVYSATAARIVRNIWDSITRSGSAGGSAGGSAEK